MAQGGFIDFKALQSELRLPCFEGDVNALIDTFCLEVLQGSPISLETFKSVWKAQSFSFIHQATPAPMVPQEFMQLLYSTALNRLDTGGPFAQHIQVHLCLNAASEEEALQQQHHHQQPLGADLLLLQGPQDTQSHQPQQQQQQQQQDPFSSLDHLPLGISPHARDELIMLRDFLDDLEDGGEGSGREGGHTDGGNNPQGGAGSAADPTAADSTAATAAVAAHGAPHAAGPAAGGACGAADGGGGVGGSASDGGSRDSHPPTQAGPFVLWPPGHPLSTCPPLPPPPDPFPPHPHSQHIISADPTLTSSPQHAPQSMGTGRPPCNISGQPHMHECAQTSVATHCHQGSSHRLPYPHLPYLHAPLQGSTAVHSSTHTHAHSQSCGPSTHELQHTAHAPCQAHCTLRGCHAQSAGDAAPCTSLQLSPGQQQHSSNKITNAHVGQMHSSLPAHPAGAPVTSNHHHPCIGPCVGNGSLQQGPCCHHADHPTMGYGSLQQQPCCHCADSQHPRSSLGHSNRQQSPHPPHSPSGNASHLDPQLPCSPHRHSSSHLCKQHLDSLHAQNGSQPDHQQPVSPHMHIGSHMNHQHPDSLDARNGSHQDHMLPNFCHTQDGSATDHQQHVCPNMQSSSQQDRHHLTPQQPSLHGLQPPQQHDSACSPAPQLAMLPHCDFAAHSALGNEMALALAPDECMTLGAVDGRLGAGDASQQLLLPPWPVSSRMQLFWLAQRAAVLYFLYCLWQTQLLAPRVSVYLPLELLQLLVDSVVPELVHGNVLDAVHAFQVMWRNHAYLVGALRRPPHGTYKFKEPRHKIGKDSRSTAASTSAVMQCQPLRDALLHVRSTLPALTDLGAVDKLARQYNSARTRIFQPQSCLQHQAQHQQQQQQQQQHQAQHQQQQQVLHPPAGMLSDTFAAELREEVDRQAAEVWASLHPQAPSGDTESKKKSAKGKKHKAGRGRGRGGRGRGALLLGVGLQRDHYEFEKDPLLDSDFEGGLAGGTDPGSLLGSSAVSEEEGEAQESEEDRPPQVAGVFGALLRREYEQKKQQRQQQKQADLQQRKQAKRAPKAPAPAAPATTERKQRSPRAPGERGGAGEGREGAGAGACGDAVAVDAAAKAAEEAVMRETARGLKLVASDGALRQELREAGLDLRVLGLEEAGEEEEEAEAADPLPGALKSKAAELLRRDRARKQQAVACAGRWLNAHAALMQLDDMPPDAQDGEEVGALLDAAGLKSCVPGRSPEPQEATEPPAPDPALAAALEHEDWEGAEDKERRAPASKSSASKRGGSKSKGTAAAGQGAPVETRRVRGGQGKGSTAGAGPGRGVDYSALRDEDEDGGLMFDAEEGGDAVGRQHQEGLSLPGARQKGQPVKSRSVRGKGGRGRGGGRGAQGNNSSSSEGEERGGGRGVLQRGAAGRGRGRSTGAEGAGHKEVQPQQRSRAPPGLTLAQRKAAAAALMRRAQEAVDVGTAEDTTDGNAEAMEGVEAQSCSPSPPPTSLPASGLDLNLQQQQQQQQQQNLEQQHGKSQPPPRSKRKKPSAGANAEEQHKGGEPAAAKKQRRLPSGSATAAARADHSTVQPVHAAANGLQVSEAPSAQPILGPGASAPSQERWGMLDTGGSSELPSSSSSSPKRLLARHAQPQNAQPSAQNTQPPQAQASIATTTATAPASATPLHPPFSAPAAGHALVHMRAPADAPGATAAAQAPGATAAQAAPASAPADLPNQPSCVAAGPLAQPASLPSTLPSSQQPDLPGVSEDAGGAAGDEDTSSDDIDLASLLPSDLARLRAQQEQLAGRLPGAPLGPMDLDDSDSDDEGRRLVQESHALFALLASHRK